MESLHLKVNTLNCTMAHRLWVFEKKTSKLRDANGTSGTGQYANRHKTKDGIGLKEVPAHLPFRKRKKFGKKIFEIFCLLCKEGEFN